MRKLICFRVSRHFLLLLALLGGLCPAILSGQVAGPAGGDVRVFAIAPSQPLILYVGIDFKGIYKSLDGGQSWQATNSALVGMSIRSIAVDPQNPSIVYVGTGDVGTPGIFKTTNGGASWSLIAYGVAVFALAITPTNSAIILAGTNGGGIYKKHRFWS